MMKWRHYWEAWKADDSLQASVSLFFSCLFALYNGILGIVYRSVWNGSICVYYFLLAGIRGILVCSCRQQPSQKADAVRRVSFATHVVLLMMNVSLVVPAIVMVAGQRPVSYGLIPAIAVAAYTTYRITVSILHFVRSRRNGNILVRMLRTVNLIDTLVAVLTLQSTMIAANGGMNEEMQTLSAWISGAILALSVTITVLSFQQIKR